MKLTLFQIEALENRDGRVALLPGVPRELFVRAEVRALRQGSVIQLQLPDGTGREVSIVDYYVRVSATPSESELDSAPIVIVLSEDESREQLPIGTEVQITVSK